MGASTALRTPALALIGSDRRIVRSTETFRRRYEDAEAACEHSPELELVLAGETDAAVMSAGEGRLAIEAVTDTSGRRHAMVHPPFDDQAPPPEAPISALREPLDQSRVIAWLKDLDGRYLHVNGRYATDLGTSEDRLRGRTDAELPRRETIDGPRVQYTDDGVQEPLQLEYTIPAFENRPALVALRFMVRDLEGHPVGVCGVAAPLNEAQLARDEAVRIMQIERWSRMDPFAMRAELLEEWGIGVGAPQERWEQEPAPVRRQQPEHEWESAPEATVAASVESNAEPRLGDRVDQLERDLEQARAEAQAARADLELARSEREKAREEREHARTEAERSRVVAAEARSAALVAQGELEVARSGQARATAELTDMLRDRERQIESLHAPAALVSGLSADLQRALASERERAKELSRALDQLVARLAELGT